ncbi:MAG: adhesin transport system membrane fusion protein [Paraglaciecola sp.]|jgi:adhesin transport system membrane fusion protein
MLNISQNGIQTSIHLEDSQAYKLLRRSKVKRLSLYLIGGLLILLLIFLFLPWTQNINAKGYVTTKLPGQRPQAIQSVISGKLEKWYVREGDFVAAGDTIIFISEVKNEYFDPDLIARTAEQVDAKSQSIDSYDQKVRALQNQYTALQASLRLKIQQTQNKVQQARNKITMDSIDLGAYRTNLKIAKNQLFRTKDLQDKGLKTLTEMQEKELKVQQTAAKVTVQENKLLNQRNELMNLFIELNSIERDYNNKLAKSQSDQQSAISAKLETIASTSKLQNQLSNYSVRQQFYHITAPQSGYIIKTLKKGLGEIIKEGSDVATIMPSVYDLAVEAYLRPQDIPLLQIGSRVRLRFDGWPAIVISGWPEASTGVFTGKILAIDQNISENGQYRILVESHNEEKVWPKKLRIGTGTQAFIMLRDVPIWYEIWRQLNGFPADYYQNNGKKTKDVKLKEPLRKVK